MYAFTRPFGGVALLLLANSSGDTVTADVPDAETWSRSELLAGSGRPALRPWEARIHRRGD